MAATAELDDLLALTEAIDLDTLLHRVVDTACERTGARHGMLLMLDAAGDVTHHVTHRLSVDDARRLVDHLGRPANHLVPEASVTLDDRDGASMLLAPVDVADDELGLLVLHADPDDGFGRADRDTVTAVTRVAAVAAQNVRAFDRIERQRTWVEAAAEITESLHPPFRLGEPLRRIAAGAGRVTRAALVAVVRSSDHGYDVPAAMVPDSADLPELLDELYPAIRRAQASGVPFELRYGEHGTLVGVPLAPELAFEGVVVVALDRGRGSMSTEDRELLTSFVTHGSLVLDRAALLAERQQEVVVADRDRIARDLHDLVVQRLFATGMKLQTVRKADLGQAQEKVAEAVRELDVTIRDIRSTIFELEHGREASLRTDLTALAREYEPVLGFAPTVRTWGPLNTLVGPAVAAQALPVLREALSNCARHAAATSCVIEVEVDDGWLSLRVIDDGRGLPAVRHESGLRNLRRRAETLGGSVEVTSEQPRGTRLAWRVPLGPA